MVHPCHRRDDGGDEADESEGEQIVAATRQARGLPGNDDDNADGQHQPGD